DQLPSDSRFVAIDGNGQFVGYVNEAGNQQAFFYNQAANQLAFFQLPLAAEDKMAVAFLNEKGNLMAVSVTRTHFLLHELVDGQFVLRGKVEAECQGFKCFPDVSGKDGDEIWYLNPELDTLYQKFFSTGGKRTFTANDFEIPFAMRDVFPTLQGKLYSFEEAYYYVLANPNANRNLLFKFEPSSGRFRLLPGMPIEVEDAKVFTDSLGNLVFLLKQANGEYYAVLQDTEGRRYDYSAFFKSSLLKGAVLNLKSPDFKRQLLACHFKGILLQTVKATNAISHILPGVSVRVMKELPDKRIIIATQQSGGTEFIYDPETGTLEDWPNPECHMGVSKLIEDGKGFIWGMKRSYFLKYDPSTNSCQKFPVSASNIVFAFVGGSKIAYLEKGSPEHLALFDRNNGASSPVAIGGGPLNVEGFVHDMLYSRSGLLWIATTQGLVKVDLEKQSAEVIGLDEPFIDFRFLCIHEDEKGLLWLGTSLGGVHIFDPATGELKILNGNKGLANNTVASIMADDDGDRWVGTYNGISIVSFEGELKANLYQEDGLTDKECNRYAYLKTSDGKLLIGTVAGLNIIEPDKIKQRFKAFANLKIFLNSVSYYATGGNKLISKNYGLDSLGTLILPASRRNIRLKFALSNYFQPEYNQYAYQLEGVSDDWIPLGNQHTLHLDNLPAGKYRLLVRGSDGSGNVTGTPLAIAIHAKEHFYKQAWFYLLCLALLSAFSLLWIQRLRIEVKKATETIQRDKETIEIQAEALKELDKAKSRFFTNITHEFRTPLTIISGMVEQVRSKPDVWLEKGTKIIKQNTLNLLNLINQILDLRKLESKNLKLNLMQGDIVQYLRYLSESYQSYAENEGLQLHFLAATPSVVMDYDPDKILRIVSNLLANAIKYNREGGHIYFQVEKIGGNDGGEHLRLRVQDTGEGIPPEKLPEIFDLFYVAHQPGEKKVVGSGIGMALTQELVKLMNGEIEVESQVGVGTTFTVKLPVARAAEMKAADFATPAPVLHGKIPTPKAHDWRTDEPKADELPTLLIVEDNPQIVQILIACLEDHYHLEIAANGQEGIEKAIELTPDLIISDVMMPEKNGYELTVTLKNDERTDHIPIVLLTAKMDIDSKISGLEKGADAYLSKPFQQRELLVRLEKLLELRRKLQARYAKLSSLENAPTQLEDPFLQKFYSLVEKEISNPELDMNKLCRSLGMSRSQVFRKLKALTGTSATLFIRSIRLQKGKELLAKGELNISEVAYEIGFTSLSYFSRAYKEEFGVPPSATRK
ncbi:MAG: response regulator, partial [Phaeodactylibacter sp.]|nr:response regulator [Phaeodactylibacter sp.]